VLQRKDLRLLPRDVSDFVEHEVADPFAAIAQEAQ
jgi:hypothetical protein